MTTDQPDPFAEFAFKVGDVVVHRADTHKELPYVVIGQALIRSHLGTDRMYRLSGARADALYGEFLIVPVAKDPA